MLNHQKKYREGGMLGKKHTEETKRKIGVKAKGRPSFFKGKTYRDIYGERWKEEIEKRRQTKIKKWDEKERVTYSHRPIHHGWIYVNFVSRVFARDNYTCQMCNQRGGKLQADHIKPFAQIVKENNLITMREAIKCTELWDINNGRTLCVDCHKKTDTYGWKTYLFLKNKFYGKKRMSSM